MEHYKWCFKKQFLSLFMNKYSPQFCDLSLYSYNNGMSFGSPWTWAFRLGHFEWVVHEIFTYLTCLEFTVSTSQKFCHNYFGNQQWYVIAKFPIINTVYRLQERHLWDQNTFSSKINTCIHQRVCKQLLFDLLYLHHSYHCCKTVWF